MNGIIRDKAPKAIHSLLPVVNEIPTPAAAGRKEKNDDGEGETKSFSEDDNDDDGSEGGGRGGGGGDSARDGGKEGEGGRDPNDIGVPPIVEVYRDVIEKGVDDFKDMMANDAMWKANGENKGIQKFNLATGIGAKGFGVIDFSPQTILDVLLRPFTDPLTAALDPDMKFGRDVERPDGHTSIAYLCYKGIWPVAERDMVIAAHWRVEPDRSIFFVAKSISEAAAAGLGIGSGAGYSTGESVGVAPVKGRVRADLTIGGWHLKPIDGGRRTEATYLASLDLKGNIPGFVVKQVTAGQPMLIHTMNGIIRDKAPKAIHTLLPVVNELPTPAAGRGKSAAKTAGRKGGKQGGGGGKKGGKKGGKRADQQGSQQKKGGKKDGRVGGKEESRQRGQAKAAAPALVTGTAAAATPTMRNLSQRPAHDSADAEDKLGLLASICEWKDCKYIHEYMVYAVRWRVLATWYACMWWCVCEGAPVHVGEEELAQHLARKKNVLSTYSANTHTTYTYTYTPSSMRSFLLTLTPSHLICSPCTH